MKLTELTCGLILLAAAAAQAAPVPDSGGIRRNLENLQNPLLPPAPSPKEVEEPEAPAAEGGPTVTVTAFKITGAERYSEAELQAQLANYIGRTLDYRGLDQAAMTLSQYYRNHGWLAKVYFPPQSLEDGVVNLAVREARLGEIETRDDDDLRLNRDYFRNMLSFGQQSGEPLNMRQLESALLLMNDSPGVSARATLSPGGEGGETDVALALEDTFIVSARAWGDNYGTEPLGKERANLSFALNNPSGFGDQINLYGVFSAGLNFGQGSYEFPVGHAGTRINLGGGVSEYDLQKSGLGNADATGTTYSYRVGVRHPFLRSRNTNLGGQLTLQALHSNDELEGLDVSEKAYRTLMLAMNADHSDDFLEGGTFWGGIVYTFGDLELFNGDERAVDRVSADTDGNYNKLNFYLGRNQQLTEKLSAKALFSAQWADTNLGGFEKFFLGGPFGLTGYAVGEAPADEGWMLNLEGQYAILPELSASLLAGAGGVCLHKKTWEGWNADNPKLDNCYPLASVGAALAYRHRYFDAKVSYARQVTGNPARDGNGRDIEGETDKNQIWFQFGVGF
jgi:hemolysin activation/secretion protein